MTYNTNCYTNYELDYKYLIYRYILYVAIPDY